MRAALKCIVLLPFLVMAIKSSIPDIHAQKLGSVAQVVPKTWDDDNAGVPRDREKKVRHFVCRNDLGCQEAHRHGSEQTKYGERVFRGQSD
jgi:hypothetical protein